MEKSSNGPPQVRKRGPKFKISRATAERLLAAYRRAECTVDELAGEFGVTKQTIYNVMARLRREKVTGPDARWK